MTARALAIRVTASVLLAMAVLAMASMVIIINFFAPAVGSVLEGWVVFSFLMMCGSFLGAMIIFSVAAPAFSTKS